MMYMRVLKEISNNLWAVSDPALDAILRIVSVGDGLEDRSIFHGSIITVEERKEEIEAAVGRGKGESYQFSERHKSLGIMHMDGPIIPRDAGQPVSQPRMTTAAGLLSDLQAMENNPKIDRIAVMSDTPGGAVTLISELASAFKDCKKPIVTFVEGMAASAGYWTTSHCDAVVACDTAMVGSIGVVAKVEIGKDDKVKKFVSRQSELKQADPDTEAGEKEYQRIVDDTGDVFVNAVADARGTTREDVMENFGKGGVVIASRAEAKGMIDAVMTRKQFLSEFTGNLSACGWLKKGTSKRGRKSTAYELAGEDRFDTGGKINTESKNETPAQAEKHGGETMTLKELLESSSEAKSEFDAIVADAVKTGCAELQTRLESAALIAASDKYPTSVRNLAVEMIAGKKSRESLDAVVAVVEMDEERNRSESAVTSTEQVGETSSQLVEGRSADGGLRTTADILAALGQGSEA